uniref:Ig-like domain-containing protein n=1 Tax=Papio anubis TaxID=9555 RepID=A0A8I5N346_PAPAN
MLFASCSGLVILLIIRRTNGDSVTQTEGPVTLPERAALTLNCTYQTSYSAFMFWYVQYPNKEPELLLKSSENQETNSRGFQASHVKSDSSFHLEKPSVQLLDSAVYYCVLRDTVGGTAARAQHKPWGLQVGPGCERLWEGALFSVSRVLGWSLPPCNSGSDSLVPRSHGDFTLHHTEELGEEQSKAEPKLCFLEMLLSSVQMSLLPLRRHTFLRSDINFAM